MKTAAFCLVLLPALALPVAAQDSPLIVKTSNSEVAMGLSTQFGSFDPLPDLSAGGHYVLTLGGTGIDVSTGSGDVGLMQIQAKPGPLMDMFADQIAQVQGMAQGIAIMTLGQQGIQPGTAVQIVQAVLEFPNQIESLDLQINGDPSRLEQGLSAELSLAPVAQTWFASLVDAIAQEPAGAPMLGAGGAMQAALALGLKDKGPLEPFMSVISSMGAGTDPEKAARMDLMQRSLDVMTGALAMGFDMEGGGGMQVIAALADADGMKEIMADPAYAEWTTSSMGGAAGMDIEYEQDAFEHRGVKVSRMTVEMDAMMPNPMAPDGKFEGYYAVAGDYAVTCTYASSDAGIKALIDSVLDQKIERTKLPGNTLGTFSMEIGDMANMFAGGAPMGEVPETMTVHLDKTAGRLVLKVDMK